MVTQERVRDQLQKKAAAENEWSVHCLVCCMLPSRMCYFATQLKPTLRVEIIMETRFEAVELSSLRIHRFSCKRQTCAMMVSYNAAQVRTNLRLLDNLVLMRTQFKPTQMT
uniref:Uncharacterized protein n=1 Tax=Physcomitrium patens TaxID=3218 RepID=A0A2K1J137_PHYPA|nr:hypothetical protein PHYPA_023141 [Physcomitrium patens]